MHHHQAWQQHSWHAEAIPLILGRLETDIQGLADDEATRRLERFGLNRLTPPPPVSAGKILLDQLKSVVVGLLVAGVVISMVLGDRLEAAAIAAVLLINTLLGFVTEIVRAVRWRRCCSSTCRAQQWSGTDSYAGPPPDDPGNPTVTFHGESRRNDSHQSTTDPDARLARKGLGKEAKLSYAGHVLLDNRHGLVANVCVTLATGTAEREAAVLLLGAVAHGGTVGGDKGFDVASFVAPVRELGVTPHVAQKVKGSAIDARTSRHAGYAISQQKRKLIEQVFGWMKTVGGLRKLRHRGGARGDAIVTFTAAAYNLTRLRTLLATAT